MWCGQLLSDNWQPAFEHAIAERTETSYANKTLSFLKDQAGIYRDSIKRNNQKTLQDIDKNTQTMKDQLKKKDEEILRSAIKIDSVRKQLNQIYEQTGLPSSDEPENQLEKGIAQVQGHIDRLYAEIINQKQQIMESRDGQVQRSRDRLSAARQLAKDHYFLMKKTHCEKESFFKDIVVENSQLLKDDQKRNISIILQPEKIHVYTYSQMGEMRVLLVMRFTMDHSPVHTTVSTTNLIPIVTTPPSPKAKKRLLNGPLRPLPGMKLVYIPPGSFQMGSPTDEPGRDSDEKQHWVEITQGFYMQTTEVTNQQFVQFLNASHSKGTNEEPWFDTKDEDSDSHIKGTVGRYTVESGYDDHPVIEVSWYGAKAMCEWLSRKENRTYRLPTEAEWEYAARAGTRTPFAFGNCLSTSDSNYDGNNPLTGCSKGQYRSQTLTVGSLQKNAWGLYDMHGNVWEWCQDWKGDYSTGDVKDPTGPTTGSDRVIRGGRWGSSARRCRSAIRYSRRPEYGYDYLGFRLCAPGR